MTLRQGAPIGLFEECAFVAVTTTDLARSKCNTHIAPGQDPVIGLKVKDLQRVLGELKAAGVEISAGPFDAARGRWAELRDPDGRKVILTESG